MMNKPKPPCGKNCGKRYLGCHIDCEKYNEYVKQNEEYKKQRMVNRKWTR